MEGRSRFSAKGSRFARNRGDFEPDSAIMKSGVVRKKRSLRLLALSLVFSMGLQAGAQSPFNLDNKSDETAGAPVGGKTTIDIVVVDTADVLLVTSKQHAQDVKGLVERMKGRGGKHLL